MTDLVPDDALAWSDVPLLLDLVDREWSRLDHLRPTLSLHDQQEIISQQQHLEALQMKLDVYRVNR